MGAIVNALTIAIASGLGLLVNTGIPEKLTKTIMSALALAILMMGIQGALAIQNMTLMIISMALGAAIGEWIDFDQRLTKLSLRLEDRFSSGKESDTSFSEGFITATLLVCVGSMAIIGSLESGLLGDNSTLYTKSILDAISCFLLASSLGYGVAFSAVPVLFLQGGIILFSGFLQPVLTDLVINEVVAVGSLLLIALSLNMLEITKIKVMNLLPAMLIPLIAGFFL